MGPPIFIQGIHSNLDQLWVQLSEIWELPKVT
uniref:Uncharacterized protein n=1 Tax=Tetranychus urticae TaxID=32264 RepID=T1KHG1_TETUR